MDKNCITVSVLIFNSKGKVLLVKHKKLGTWIYPGGHVDEDEIPQKAALREVLEETGLNVRIIDTVTDRSPFSAPTEKIAEQPLIILLEDVPYPTGHHEHFDMIYIAETTPGNEKEKISEESADIGWFGEDEIDKLDIKFKGISYAIHDAFRTYAKIKKN